MTTTPSPVRPADTLPSISLIGEITAAVGYAFSDIDAGTMSASVGAGDHRDNRRAMMAALGASTSSWMDQVHGINVHTVADGGMSGDPAGKEALCDGLVTDRIDHAVAVLVADCVPVLLTGRRVIGAVHSGRNGTMGNVVAAAVRRIRDLDDQAAAGVDEASDPGVTAIIGPAIGGCCYEVPAELQADVATVVPGVTATTTWGTPSLDLVTGVSGQLTVSGVSAVFRAGGCTRCAGDARWFSHRASTGPSARPPGRQAGMIVRCGSDTDASGRS